MIGHDAMNPLTIEDRLIGSLPLPDENGSDPPIAKARPSIDKSANRGQQRSVICFEVRSARCGLGFETLGKIGPRYDLGIRIHLHCEPQFGKKLCGDIGLLTGLRGESRSLASSSENVLRLAQSLMQTRGNSTPHVAEGTVFLAALLFFMICSLGSVVQRGRRT